VSSAGKNPVILVADDNDLNRKIVKANFRNENYNIIEAVNGQEAIDQTFKHEPDLILMDIMMPGIDGLQAIKTIKSDRKTGRIPVIALTALNDREDRIKAFECGAMDFITKPFDRFELMAIVSSYLKFSLINKKYILSTVNSRTELPNRAAFRERLTEQSGGLLYLVKLDDIDTITRFYGEDIGAAIERSFAAFLQRHLPGKFRQNGVLYHFRQGTFGFLFAQDDVERLKADLIDMDDHLHQKIDDFRDEISEGEYDIDFTASVTAYRENMLETAELVIEQAIKRKVRILFTHEVADEISDEIKQNIYWLKEIREAVNDGRIIPFFQPIVSNKSGKIVKYEALVRMVGPDGTIHSPGAFLVIAKNSKYYPEITKAVISQAVEVFRKREEAVSVNISVLDMENPDIREFLCGCLEKNPEIQGRLIIEMVEQEGVTHGSAVVDFIKEVKQYGVKVAIDDFGSGYSNFRRIVDLKADYVKIDGSLIRSVPGDKDTCMVVEIIKELAVKSDMEVIAEFVEGKEVKDYLTSIGVEYSQGYYIGQPVNLISTGEYAELS
jgi:EAL domain-containing protein (putative c-di-GMP-specific phosphodiesterase class I)/DNA-binding NarL/FixJ family response regulator